MCGEVCVGMCVGGVGEKGAWIGGGTKREIWERGSERGGMVGWENGGMGWGAYRG